ncbi:hypothetical protein [Brevibacillus laterosporus]|uniref:Uncharacterized protein n=1 Tax=Brevibacillus laterosporus TaxID=1465 RepID=A0AAP3G6X7_BRELA|nr:hypothetical protein [Brevibacillus laterosporus]MCR8978496.1 hypothetical protein [Brevibacillus laterosporus]MCZ0805651.1 hypothetical protein [Brevibacillus laterosporus]MCZ0828008.1 hypothetical protein [Brevibacillus laterosporus]MCZ0851970.1 hypothetical protein [Brevibacillus laterosporus]
MSLIVKISIKDDKGKEAGIELQENDYLAKLVIIQNVFNLFGVDKDILKTVNEFEKIGKAYSNFFDNMKQEEEQEIEQQEEQHQNNNNEIQEQSSKDSQEAKESNDNQVNVVHVSDYLTTGIKEDSNGTKRYKLRYECPICMNKGVHYIYKNSTETWCHACGSKMPIKSAHKEGFPNRDSHGNFYRAGDYYDYSS